MLTEDEAADSVGIISPFNWGALKWEEYVENEESSYEMNYKEVYENLLTEKEKISKETAEN